jgi:hypothetical protein
MGGPGSGPWSHGPTKPVVEQCRRLDVRAWARCGLLQPGTHFTVTWRTRDTSPAAIDVRVDVGGVWLVARHAPPVALPIVLTWAPCAYGGRRPWFRCPDLGPERPCGRRVTLLYAARGRFGCRPCAGLAYASQRRDRAARRLDRAERIRRRLGGPVSVLEDFPPRPPGMHRRTYARLRAEAQAATHEGLALTAAKFAPKGAF